MGAIPSATESPPAAVAVAAGARLRRGLWPQLKATVSFYFLPSFGRKGHLDKDAFQHKMCLGVQELRA